MKDFLMVGLGGMLGSVSRYGVYLLVTRLHPSRIFLATLAVNLVGCLLIGILAGYLSRVSQQFTLFMVAGFCGGFTTFSTFAIDGIRLMREGLWLQFGLYAFTSMVGGMLLAALGLFLASKW